MTAATPFGDARERALRADKLAIGLDANDYPIVDISIPIRLVSEANVREHWAVKSKRASAQRFAARVAMRVASYPFCLPAIVRITRVGPRSLDTDNLARSAKAVRDGIADWLGVDDGSPLVSWHYSQRKGERGEYAVQVEVWANPK